MHIMPILALFVPQIATQVYTVLDKTMIDLFKGAVEAGYYDQSHMNNTFKSLTGMLPKDALNLYIA